MQSSFRNAEKVRLNTVSHSAGLSFSGELGTCPTGVSRSVAVDNAEAAERRFRLALPPAPEDEPGSGADAARQQETDPERPGRNHGEIGAQLGADVGRLADLLAERLRRTGQLFSLGLDVAAHLLEGPTVATGHRSSAPRSSALPRGSPA